MGSSPRPTRVRYGVLAFLCGLTFLLYLDRMCMGQAAPFIQRELDLSDRDMGLAHASFTVAYGLFEIVTGHWGDRFGSRAVLTRIVLWWSVFTALTGTATGFLYLLAVRFLFGVGEAGALPNAARVTEIWFPPERRGAMRGIVNMPALIGAMIAPPLTARLIESTGWRWVFAIYGIFGVFWAGAFWCWFRDRPHEHPRMNQAERELIGPSLPPAEHSHIPWGMLFTNRKVWLLGTVLISGAATVYTLSAWYPTYLDIVYGLSNQERGWQSALVMFGGVLGCLVGGWAADLAAAKFPTSRWRRSGVGACGFALAAVAMVVGSLASSAMETSICFATACFGIHAHAGAYWGIVGDVGGRHIGSLFAAINSLGALGAAGAQALFGFIPRADWNLAFTSCGALLSVGAICWALVDSRKPSCPLDHMV